MMDEVESRFPLSPMQDNILAGSEPPPPSLELPAAYKGENIEADTSVAPSRAGSAVPTEESRSPLTRLPDNASGGGGGRPPSAELFFKGEALELQEESMKADASMAYSEEEEDYVPSMSLSSATEQESMVSGLASGVGQSAVESDVSSEEAAVEDPESSEISSSSEEPVAGSSRSGSPLHS